MSIPGSVVVEGVILGLNYGLLALGLVLVYKTNRVLNFAQGQMGVVAAVFLVKCTQNFGFNYWFSLVLSLALAGAMGGLSELLLRRLAKRPRVLVMVATIGLSQVLLAFTALPFIRPSQLSKPFPVPIHLTFAIGNTVFSPGQVLSLIVAPVVALAIAAVVKFSPWGLAMRAASENADSARLSGIWVRRTSTITWILAGVLSAFTAILASPGQSSVLTVPLSPDLLLFALTAALVGAMVNLTVAFFSGIAVGVIYEILLWNITSTATVQTIMFGLLLAVLVVRVTALRKSSRTEDRSSWLQGGSASFQAVTRLRARVGTTGVVVVVVVAGLLPLVLSVGKSYLMSEICIYGVIALSMTVLTGWAGQVSLGQFGLVAVGAIMATHLSDSVPLVLLLPFVGAVTAVAAVVVGLPALRVRGLYLAVSTLAFALWVQVSVAATPCWTVPIIGRRLCTGLPNPTSTYIPTRSTFFGLSLATTRSFAWFSLGVLVVSLLVVRVWRDHGVARRLVAVRDNEHTAAAMGIPVVRSKLLAFALSGFMAGYAGVCLALATQRFQTSTFDPSLSILVVSMVVIGGLGSVPGAVLGAMYLLGLPAIFGTNATIKFLTSGFGLLVFILYLPGGLSEVMHRFGDVTTDGVRWLLQRRSPPPGEPADPEGPTGPGRRGAPVDLVVGADRVPPAVEPA